MMDGYRNYLRWGHLVDDDGKPIRPSARMCSRI